MSYTQNLPDNQQPEEHKLFQSKGQSPRKYIATAINQEVQFEKNYPKNIFIPLLEYLAEMGFRSNYQKIIGTRDDFQGKNVVSLSEIFLLLNQDWFNEHICRSKALVYISNRILINSKIKKKLFHLLISKQILLCKCSNLKDFKRSLSKEAYNISKQLYEYDQAFQFPNIIIYLLSTFKSKLTELKSTKHEKSQQLEYKQQVSDQTKLKSHNQTSSKEEYKFYVKEIVHILSSKYINVHFYHEIYRSFNEDIMKRQQEFRAKYNLSEGIPNWTAFANIVCSKCILFKKKESKITNFSFHEWINEYKMHIFNIGNQKLVVEQLSEDNDKSETNKESQISSFNCTSIIQKLQCFNKRYKQEPDTLKITISKPKEFTPILIDTHLK